MCHVYRGKSKSFQQNRECCAHRVLAWPNLDVDAQTSLRSATDGSWVQLSPFDLYCVERFGYLIDRLLQRELVKGYGHPQEKIPTRSIEKAEQIPGLDVRKEKYQVRVIEALDPEGLSTMVQSLRNENAAAQAHQLELRHQEIAELQKCPICSGFVQVSHQPPDGFVADCPSCKTTRYLRRKGNKREYEQCLDGMIDFKLVGRRSFLFEL